MNDKKDDDKKQTENDPYDFFKLSADNEKGDNKPSGNGPQKGPPFWTILLVLAGVLIAVNMMFSSKPTDLIDFSEFRNLIDQGQIVRVELGENYFTGYTSHSAGTSQPSRFGFMGMSLGTESGGVYRTSGVLMEGFIEFLDEKGVDYKFVTRQNNYLIQLLLNLVIPFGFIFLMYFFIFRKMGGGMGGMGSILGGGGRSKAVDEGKVKTRFQDVAGVDEAKEELMELVDFLKQPKKYTDIGGKIPKGALLVGPPGTGKTLLARAVAGEAGVPFFRISGSDFVEMFVGVGASRVRDLFRSAREKAPCIIFIDELDAIGKSRVNNLGGNDEREQTLNQLLVEMDGFDNEKGLIILAATNRPDILDPALLRPGRFDRQIVVDKPDVKGREEILRLHAKNVKIDPSVDFSAVAHATSGFAGADLANIVNEAALLAVRAGRKVVLMDDFDEAIEKTLVGLKKKSRVVKENERKIVAYHETGHALVAAFTPGSDPVHKITIIPRGMGALGYTLQRSEDDQFLYSKKELMGQVDVLLGGRAAEQIIFGEISTGASNDISRATDIIKRMITDYGMSEKFKNVTLGKSGRGYGTQEPELVREFSEDTQKYVDDEIARVMEERYQFVLKTLKKHGNLLEYIAQRLLEKETMDGKEFQEIVKAEDHCNELESTAVKNSSEEKEKPKRARKPRAKKDVTEEK
ncbi:ATP-dependent zinc metalloprotease FtsH [Treponema succinifaciens]|uniref:ATP-dependent zinc metalloprotease FtsH n=1 Tax=Treponema succinifaciens (strain ATCC 33096 / DSM 2489 / 6091) TaxID=869209 RepID=F2NUK0_TRES6|nr:ATP-dependent zinc metalloprotease FtsH [Treponema succinifaciens]AEB13563.1 ATP-dependent metalloprotease FtsH [Treponema succinifaciens DSM 2489]MCI6912565.1 ATP-dependent zinc metalloprotease FtsH [Treponema succinifaciens]